MEINIARQRFDPRGGGEKLDIVRGPVNITAGDLTVTGRITATTQAATITDPGDAGTITPVADAAICSCSLTSGTSAETRVLGTPDHIGQVLLIDFDTDGGGDITIDNTAGFNDDGTVSNLATFADAGDVLRLVAVGTVDGDDWRAAGKKGVTLA